eukprot:3799631-Rhodomonas_salina.2
MQSDPEVGTYFSGPLSDVEDIPPDDRPLKVENGTSGRAVPWFGKPLATPDMQKSIRRRRRVKGHLSVAGWL